MAFNTLYSNRSNSPFPEDEPGNGVPKHIAMIQSLKTTGDDVSSFTHFVTTMKKNVLIKMRGPVSTAVETFLPLLFVIGLLFIWLAVDNGDTDRTNFIKSGNPTDVADFSGIVSNTTCIHSPHAPPTGLRACSAAEEASGTLQCFSQPPVSGLCTVGPGMQHVNAWLDFERPRYVPGLDEMIMMHWIANSTVSGDLEDSSYREAISALANVGFVHFAPDTAAVRALAAHLNSTSALFRHAHGNIYPDEAAAVAAATGSELANLNWAVVDVRQLDAQGVDVVLRMNRSGIPDTNILRTNGDGIGIFGARNYFAAGFFTLQDAITRYHQRHVL
eukprot:CAMPEP_0174879174 /NCGR_PEP_ID=MMETSP1114-20130205/83127_1 /TAXON_ID=312471 /ORGANISM="Neobodo designis, Strain CCAP 1951/1" /LENGTH=330 /DNA_ID=CAMNT_0016114565 /DNA_START=920 /DNA_END=1908 /DNA_ORIENTATION=-